MPPRPIEEYQVGWVCALPKELAAARAILDEEHGPIPSQDERDHNNYVLGRVHNHNVVIACLPAGVDGNNAAATVAANMLRTFTGLRFGLLVGIGGGIPNLEKDVDIRLGDVVISQPDKTHGGVVQFDKGKSLEGGLFERKGSLNKPPSLLLTALASLQAHHEIHGSQISAYLRHMLEQHPHMEETGYTFPGVEYDCLYCANCKSVGGKSCDRCKGGKVYRKERRHTKPMIHYGIVASGNQVVKDSAVRDRLAAQFEAKCVEMEAAGLMDDFPCLVIRGICDYADVHKNDMWHRYAASTAAAYTKEFLSIVPSQDVSKISYAADVMNHRTHELLGESNQLQKQAIEVQREHSHKSEVRHQTERERHCHQAFKTSPYEEYKNNNPERVLGTCRWVLDHTQFQVWQQSSFHSLLWISADPGCGKSVLARFLIDHEFGDADQYSVCYFFFKDNERQDNLATALCAVLHQLFDRNPSLLRYALPAWEKNKDKIQQEKEEMWRILLAAAADPSAGPIICVLDALDECRDEDRRQLISKLCDFYQRSSPVPSGLRLKFLVTSRPYDSVQRWFEETTSRLPQIRLRGEDENNQIHKEINLVIDRRIDNLASEFMLSENHQEKLRQSLRQMKHRTYLWLHLAVEDIRTTYRDSPDPEEEPTNTLPISVENAYERILQRITERQKSLARKILLIIVGARRPLTISEMSLALSAARAHELGQSCIKEPNVQHLERQVRQWCGLFVFINHSQLFLIHQTAKEFLVAQNLNSSSVSTYWKSTFSQTEIEGEMARLCVTYLCLCQQDRRPSDERRQGYQRANNTESRVIQSPTSEVQNKFFEYCAEHWTSHLREDVVTKDKKVLDKVLLLYTTDTDLFHAWFPIMWKAFYPYLSTPKVQIQHAISMSDHAFILNEISHRAIFELEAWDSTGRTALHWAAERGHGAVVNWLIQSGADINTQGLGRYSNALEAASGAGHEEIVQFLVDKGADVNAQGGEYGNALQVASRRGYEKIVQFLVDKGGDVNAQGGQNGNALQAASRWGHEGIVQFLVDKGADVNAQGGGWYSNALLAASGEGYEKIVQFLVDKGADVNAQGGVYGSALQAASGEGHEKIVQFLVDKGADVNAQGGGWYSNALLAASGEGYEKIVQFLVDKGADVNAQGGEYGSALHAALRGGHERIVQFLVHKGANINAQGGVYRNALQAASEVGYEKIVQFLVDKGADVNAQGGKHGSALHAASRRGHERIVQFLVDKGADVNAQGGKHGSALHAALRGGHERIVQFLVHKGANINAQGGVYSNALQVASERGHEGIVQFLVDKGADVNAQGGGWYSNALLAASGEGYEKIVQFLVDKGADVNAQEGEYGNALQAASGEGHEKIVQFLVDKGANINAQGGEYGNALQAASGNGHEKIVQFLVDKGADVNVQGGEYGSALQAASRGGHEGIVQILYKQGAIAV